MVDWVKRHPLAYVAVTVPVMLIAWELFARQFTVPAPTLPPLAALSIPLYEATRESAVRLSPQPRLLILGNSQIHYVRDQDDVQTYGFPAQLQRVLTERGMPTEVADLSEGGQQVVESLAILIDTFDRVRPDHVVLGLGLANMRGTTIPPQLVSALDWDLVRTKTERHFDERIAPEISASLLQLYSPPKDAVVAHDPTIQEQLDERLADWLMDHAATVRHRSVMSQWVTKLPGDLEREVRMAWRRKARGQFKARTYDAGPNYELSLAVVRIMAYFCREQHVPFTVITMPFHPSCTPILYVPRDAHRLNSDLEQLADQGNIRRLDLQQLLGPEHFSTFQDGSPDGLHFLATGHARLATEVGEQLYPQLHNRSSPFPIRFADANNRDPSDIHSGQ